MPEVRGKFRVTTITKNHYNPTSANIVLVSVYTGTPEDNSYSSATPYGKIEMYVSNPSAVETLALGKSFYVDFTQVD